MIRTYILFFTLGALLLQSCNGSNKKIVSEMKVFDSTAEDNIDPILKSDVKSIVNKDFHKYYTGYLQEQDSCFFRFSINHEYNTTEIAPFVFFNDCIIHHGVCEQINLDFSIMKRMDSDSLYFYIHQDTYELTFSDKSTLGTIIHFNNTALNNILNSFIRLQSPIDKYERFPLLETYLSNIYFSSYGYFANVKRPFFDWTLSLEELTKNYRNKKNCVEFDELFKDKDTSRMLIFENKYFGAIVFRYEFLKDNTFRLEEFIMPKTDRVKQFLGDTVPDYLRPCLVGH
jgi:hypothetical protein